MSKFIHESLGSFDRYATTIEIARGERLFSQGDSPDGCYLVVSGRVLTHYYDADIHAEANLQTYQDGEVVGSIGAIDKAPRNISATAETDIVVRHINAKSLLRMTIEDINAYQQFIQLSSNTVAKKFRELQEAAVHVALASSSSPVVDATVERAVAAQSQFVSWPENKVEEVIRDVARAVNDCAPELAEECVMETGFGVLDHKIKKIRLGTIDVAESLKGQPGSDHIHLEAPGVENMAMPVGVVFGMIPVTNPVETIVFKSLIALKARNAIIISSHRKARNVGDKTVDIIRTVLEEHGAPADLVQTPELAANRKLTQAFMSHDKVNFILATGGPSMVKSAYRSGTPAIGVGKGNAPVWVCADARLPTVAHQVVNSKSFDNGIVCGSENNLLVDAKIADDFIEQLVVQGAAVLSSGERDHLIKKAFTDCSVDGDWIGKSAQEICNAVGIERPYEIKLIVAEVENGNLASPLVREKLAPMLSLVRVTDQEDALFHAKTILSIEGRGHTAIVHTDDREKVNAYAAAVEVSRVLVNSPGTQGCIGACNGLQLSWTLGCGTMGGGSTSDNVSYKHLQNTKRVAYA